MSPISHALIWVSSYRFEDERWFHDAPMLGELIDLLVGTSFWPLLDVMGADGAGVPIASAAQAKRRLLGSRGHWLFARGGPRTTLYTDESEAWLKVDLAPGYLGLGAGVRGSVLAGLGPRAIDDFLEVLCALRRRWGARAALRNGTCAPGATSSIPWPLHPASRIAPCTRWSTSSTSRCRSTEPRSPLLLCHQGVSVPSATGSSFSAW